MNFKHVKIALLTCLLLACDGSTGVAQTSHYRKVTGQVNQAVRYPVNWIKTPLKCDVNPNQVLGEVSKGIFGTNLEWFNDAGGLGGSDADLKQQVISLVKSQQTSIMRFPGGTLADFYHWKDGIGPIEKRPVVKHPTDPGRSNNRFGTPEFYHFLQKTGASGLITVNAGTASASEAAEWVAYANQPNHVLRQNDGIVAPMDIKLWEIGNELYLPGNPGEQIITVSPEVYADRYLAFSKAMKKVDPSITTMAIGVAISHQGPMTQYTDWTEVLLKRAAKDIDMIAVHNAYFPLLIEERQPHVKDVYPALWAAPEAVDRSLTDLEQLITKYEQEKKIDIAITEWGALFSLPDVDNEWLDHVKTIGSGVYVARLLQVMMSHPRVKVANYFKLVDRSFMGWVSYTGQPKVPFHVVSMYATHSGTKRVMATMESPLYNTQHIGTIKAESGVPEMTVLATVSKDDNKLYLNYVNRSMTTGYPVSINVQGVNVKSKAVRYELIANEMTAHNGKDIPPEWPYGEAIEPYTTALPGSVKILTSEVDIKENIKVPPFSIVTLELDMVKAVN